MNIIYSYNSNNEITLFEKKMFAAAILSAHKHVKDANIVVYCSKSVFDFFSSIKCPHKTIVIDYEKFYTNFSAWNFPKIISYGLQDEPFVHCDLDLIFIKDTEFSNADIYCEFVRDYDKDAEELEFCDLSKKIPDKIICSAVYGGSKIDIFKELYDRVYKIVNSTDKTFSYKNLYSMEEVLFTQLINERNLSIKSLDENCYFHLCGDEKEFYDDLINFTLNSYDYEITE